jgi:hypothetical protein
MDRWPKLGELSGRNERPGQPASSEAFTKAGVARCVDARVFCVDPRTIIREVIPMRMLIPMGDIGVILPGSRVTALATYGASPCVILGIARGGITILSHVHKVNSINDLKTKLQILLSKADVVESPSLAFISTLFVAESPPSEELVPQMSLVASVLKMLRELDFPDVKTHTDSAAYITNNGEYLTFDDELIIHRLEHKENMKCLEANKDFDSKNGRRAVNSIALAFRFDYVPEFQEQGMKSVS